MVREKRPELPREHPIRNLSELWQNAARAATGMAADMEADPQTRTNTQSNKDTAQKQDEASAVIGDAVRNAYSVIDRYLNEGQRIASELGQSYASLATSNNPQELQARWLQSSSEFVAGWMDMVGQLTEGANFSALFPGGIPGMPFSNSTANNTADVHPKHSKPTTINFEVSSPRTVKLSGSAEPAAYKFDTCDGVARRSTPPAHSEKANATPAEISFQTKHDIQEQSISISLVVGDEPSGIYCSHLVNSRTGEILGNLCVEVI